MSLDVPPAGGSLLPEVEVSALGPTDHRAHQVSRADVGRAEHLDVGLAARHLGANSDSAVPHSPKPAPLDRTG